MSEVFGDDFPDVFSTVLNDAEVAARRQVESATAQLVATLRNRTVAEHKRAVRAEREVARLAAHLQTCEAARTNAEVRLAELEAAVTRVAAGVQCLPADATGDAMLCAAEHAASDTPPVCAACHHVRVQQLQARVAELEAEARGDRQARDQLVQAVRVAIREAVPGA